LTGRGQLLENQSAHRAVSIVVNVFRSIPFIILIVWMIPFTRLLVNTSSSKTNF
jgi:D-methionine transport system permease protein